MKKAIIVGVNIDNEEAFEESMKELKGLAKACDFKVVGSLTQNLNAVAFSLRRYCLIDRNFTILFVLSILWKNYFLATHVRL